MMISIAWPLALRLRWSTCGQDCSNGTPNPSVKESPRITMRKLRSGLSSSWSMSRTPSRLVAISMLNSRVANRRVWLGVLV